MGLTEIQNKLIDLSSRLNSTDTIKKELDYIVKQIENKVDMLETLNKITDLEIEIAKIYLETEKSLSLFKDLVLELDNQNGNELTLKQLKVQYNILIKNQEEWLSKLKIYYMEIIPILKKQVILIGDIV